MTLGLSESCKELYQARDNRGGRSTAKGTHVSTAMQTEPPLRKDTTVEAQLDGTPSAEHAAAMRGAAECVAAKAAERVAAECVAAAHLAAECVAAEAAECVAAKRVAAECDAAVRGAAESVAAEHVTAECERPAVKRERGAAERDAAERGAGSTAQPLSGRTPVTASKAAPKDAHAEAKRLKNEGNKACMARRWAEAATEYRRAIELWPRMP